MRPSAMQILVDVSGVMFSARICKLLLGVSCTNLHIMNIIWSYRYHELHEAECTRLIVLLSHMNNGESGNR
jgi:hypothetical protein